ncbi:helix-turn-helix transcriptional regulator [Pedobacter agri]|uniref:helix-turn-helix domain-containing protein n=1 Tax=Pedobacter agri TaxID=454586 RepID=UPI00292D8D9F|nr:helix-turn-helix transcriptional regulator [Pedobacter agri]
MNVQQPYRIKTIKEYHKILGAGNPEHPMISVIDLAEIIPYRSEESIRVIFDFYIISLKKVELGNVEYGYGQQKYDFDDGILFFISPNQIFSFKADEDFRSSGTMLLIHPDFLWGNPLAKTIKKYEFFTYAINEALFVSDRERLVLDSFIKNIEQEYHSYIDKFSESIIISQIESFLNYSNRFYMRQFLTRKISGSQILDKLEKILNDYFNDEDIIDKGLPSVQYIAGLLNCSPNYLSNTLKTLTGRNTQQHIHEKIIEKAKEKLSTTTLTVGEIAFELGFEYPQSFSKLFKSKTDHSPVQFRESFN